MYADSSRRQNKRVGNYVVIKFMQRKLAEFWGAALPPPQKFFSILSLKIATFSAFWVLAHAARGGHGPSRPPLDPPVCANIVTGNLRSKVAGKICGCNG